MTISDTTDINFARDTQCAEPVLIDFWAPWCGPCKALTPHLDKLADKTGDNLKIMKLNIDENPEIPKKYNVRGIPTLIFMVDGKEEGRLVGASATRMNVTVEKWMSDRGLPVAGTAPTDAPVTQAQPAAPQRASWSAFSGDANLKAVSVASLEKITADQQALPSNELADSAEQFESVLGMPAAVGSLIDVLWHLNYDHTAQPFEQMRATVAGLLQAIPVGADLGDVPRALAYAATYESDWAITGYADSDAAKAAVAAIRSNHDQEMQGLPVSPAAWEQAQRAVILLPDTESAIQDLEYIGIPFSGAHAIGVLAALLRLAENDTRRAPHWTKADGTRRDQAEEAYYAAANQAVGPRPTDNEADLVNWQTAMSAFTQQWRATQRAADPDFWQRSDQHTEALAALRKAMYDYVAKELARRLAALGK